MTSRERIWRTTRRCRRRGQACWLTAGPAFYLEHLKRLRKNGIQPYFVPAHVHQLEIIERLIRAGVYMGPLNMAIAGYGGGTLGRNPFDWMELLRARRRARRDVLVQHAGADLAVRDGDRPRAARARRQRGQPLGCGRDACTTVQQIEGVVRLCKEFGRKVATAEEARKIMKIGAWYDSVEETLQQPRPAAQPARSAMASSSGRPTEAKTVAHRHVQLASDGLLHGAAGPDRRRWNAKD